MGSRLSIGKKSIVNTLYVLLLTMLSVVHAETIKISNSNVIKVGKSGKLTASGIASGIILMLVGFMFMFFGRRLIHMAIYMTGFVFFALLALSMLYKISPPLTGENMRAILYLLVSAIVGIFGGLLFVYLYKCGLFLVGAIGGMALATYLLTWGGVFSRGFMTEPWARILFIVLMSIVAGSLILFFERKVTIISTSIYGSYTFFVGFDCFTRYGFAMALFNLLDNIKQIKTLSGGVIGLMVATGVFTVVGALSQFRSTSS